MPERITFDLNGDSIPDLVVMGYAMGTEKEQAGSVGQCFRGVSSLPGTQFLQMLTPEGYWDYARTTDAGTLDTTAMRTAASKGHLRWVDGGHVVLDLYYDVKRNALWWKPQEPSTWERSIVRISTASGPVIGVMEITCSTAEGSISAKAWSHVPETSLLIGP